MTELQPCKCHNIPHIEKTAELYTNCGLVRGTIVGWYIKCDKCGKTYGDFLSREAAVYAWNRKRKKEEEV